MSIKLDTGIIQPPRHPQHGHSSGLRAFGAIDSFNDTTPSELVVFPAEARRVLLVEPQTMLVLTAYNLAADGRVAIRKVLRSNGVPLQGDTGCCPYFTVGHTISLHSVEIPCWRLDKCNPVFVLHLPGAYEIDVMGANIDVLVTATAHPLQPYNPLPPCDCE